MKQPQKAEGPPKKPAPTRFYPDFPMDEYQKIMLQRFLGGIEIKPYGVLGRQKQITGEERTATAEPTAQETVVDPADIAFLGDVNDIANDAETDAFNVAIEAATGDEKVALQVNTPSLSSSSHLIPTPSKSFSNLHFQARKKLRRLTNKPERQDKE